MVTMTSKPARRFQRGRGVYTCATCGRRTRETTVQGSEDCNFCFELAGMQNTVWDGGADEYEVAERERLLEAIVSLGGDGDKVKAAFADLFAFTPKPAEPVKTEVGQIDLTPSWVAAMPILIAALEDGTDEGKRLAREELMDLAKRVDEMNAKA